MINVFWPEFSILFVAAFFGGIAILPYSLQLLKSSSQGKPLKISKTKLLLLSSLQTVVLSAVTIGIGLLASHKIGLGAPYIEAIVAGKPIATISPILTAIVLGALGGLFLLLFDVVFFPYLPKSLVDSSRSTSLIQNFAASFYGGINEEFLMRLFGLSVLAWVFSKIWHTPTGLPTTAVFWVVNVAMAAIFGLGHLPATKKLVVRITPFLVFRTLLLNGVVGLLCGWLFWNYGIEAAVVAHFSADIIYHVVGTIVLQLNDKHHFRQTEEN